MASRELTAFGGYCARMARKPGVPANERELWQMLADEVDAYRATARDLEPDGYDRAPTAADVPLA